MDVLKYEFEDRGAVKRYFNKEKRLMAEQTRGVDTWIIERCGTIRIKL